MALWQHQVVAVVLVLLVLLFGMCWSCTHDILRIRIYGDAMSGNDTSDGYEHINVETYKADKR